MTLRTGTLLPALLTAFTLSISGLALAQTPDCEDVLADKSITHRLDVHANHLDPIVGWEAWNQEFGERISASSYGILTALGFENNYDRLFWSNLDLDHDGEKELILATEFLQGTRSYRKAVTVFSFCPEIPGKDLKISDICSLLSMDSSLAPISRADEGIFRAPVIVTHGVTLLVSPSKLLGRDYLVSAHSAVGGGIGDFFLWELGDRGFQPVLQCSANQ